jgi:hypothetical protein
MEELEDQTPEESGVGKTKGVGISIGLLTTEKTLAGKALVR